MAKAISCDCGTPFQLHNIDHPDCSNFKGVYVGSSTDQVGPSIVGIERVSGGHASVDTSRMNQSSTISSNAQMDEVIELLSQSNKNLRAIRWFLLGLGLLIISTKFFGSFPVQIVTP